MKLFRCTTCGFVLTPQGDRYLRKHIGHRLTSGGNVKFFEQPKVWIWRGNGMAKKIVRVLLGIPTKGNTDPEAYDNRLELCMHIGNLTDSITSRRRRNIVEQHTTYQMM